LSNRLLSDECFIDTWQSPIDNRGVPRLVLFDIDLTLIASAGGGRAAMESAFNRLWAVERATEGISFDGRTDRGIFIEVLERYGKGGPGLEDNLAGYMEGYLQDLPGALAARGGSVLPGVPELLAALAVEQPGFGLATGNIRRGAEVKLGYFGLWEHFLGGGFGDAHAVRADLVSAGIRELAARLETDPNPRNAIVLGDTPLDIEAAHKAGAIALGVGTGRFTAEQLAAAGADYAVDDLSDTARVLEILTS
jgi:phosphoglycolate phosphatase-like HAD superfamily hydrolase